MSFIRFKQAIVTRLNPHNANKRYVVTNKRFNPDSVNPLNPFEFEFRSAVADSSVTLPYALSPLNAWDVDFEFARIFNQDNQPLLCNSKLQVTLQVPSGNIHRLSVSINGVLVDYTAPDLAVANWYRVSLSNKPNPGLGGTLLVFLDGSLLGSISYPEQVYTPDNLIAAGFTSGGSIAACRCVIRNVTISTGATRDQMWRIDDNAATIKNTGTNPVANGTLQNGSNPTSQWLLGTASAEAITYSYSATDVADALLIRLDRAWIKPINTTGVVVKLQPAGTVLPVSGVTSVGNLLRIALTTPQALAVGETLRLEYTRVLASTMPVVTIAFTVPRTGLFEPIGSD